MKCPNCGAPVNADSRFCSYCGESLAADKPREKQEIHIHYHQEVRQEQPTRVEHVYIPKETFSRKNRAVALLLCLLLGVFGAHKFYLGKFWVGVLYIFTYGLFGIGLLIDLVVLIAGNPTDKKGYRIVWKQS